VKHSLRLRVKTMWWFGKKIAACAFPGLFEEKLQPAFFLVPSGPQTRSVWEKKRGPLKKKRKTRKSAGSDFNF
jgi:hypothetical protein